MQEEVTDVSIEKSPSERFNYKKGAGISGVILAIVLLISFSVFQTTSKKNEDTKRDTNATQSSKQNAILYGYVGNNNTILEIFDTETEVSYSLTNFDRMIKKVTPISKDEIIFIDNTDNTDYGRSISTYSLSRKQLKKVYETSSPFGIDYYVISPNKKYLAIWQVQLDKNTGTLLNGKSQVITKRLDSPPDTGTIIYNEVPSTISPVHFPIGITNDGMVIVDSMIPNSNIQGWQRGISTSSIDGKEIKELPDISNGKYATQPILSSDGQYIAYAGYNGSDGSHIVDGIKKAQLYSNTIELFELNSEKKRTIISSDIMVYDNLRFSPDDKSLYFTSTDGRTKSLVEYDFRNNVILRSIPLDRQNELILGVFPQNKPFIGVLSAQNGTLSNLGDAYTPSIEKYKLYAPDKKEFVFSHAFTQYISIAPSDMLGYAQQITGTKEEQLQLTSFSPRLELVPAREKQTTKPPLKDKVDNYVTPTPIPVDCANERKREIIFGEKFEDVRNKDDYYYRFHNICVGTPLYVYAPLDEVVDINIRTDIFDPNPYISNSYSVIGKGNGTFDLSGNTFDSISYYYHPKNYVTPPENGYVVRGGNIKEKLSEIGNKLGFSEIEKNDFINHERNFRSPFVFIGFYNQSDSKRIHPIELSSNVNTYLNYVFYFEQLNEMPIDSLMEPHYPSIPQRGKVTVVDISEMILR